MSYSHTQRRKTIQRFKKKYGYDGFNGEKWHSKFIEYIAELERERLGPPIGTLEDILGGERRTK